MLLVGEAVGQKQREENQGRWGGGEEGGRKKPPKRKDKGEGKWREQEESG